MKLRVKYQGTFKNRDNNKTYRVTIQNSDIATTRQIVDPTERNFKPNKDNVMFAKNPVVISLERDEMTQQILIRQATIRLKANFDLSDTFFADTNRSIKVIIEQKVGNSWVSVFNGFVDPLQFQQGAAYNYESFTIHATDPLGALEDTKVNQLPTLLQTDIPPIKNIITDCINAIGCDIDYSHWVASPNIPNDDISANMGIFYGESVDDYMSLKEILETLLRYQGAMLYYNPAINKVVIQNMYITDTTSVDFDFKHNAMDDSTTMSMSDAYNRVKLKCEIEPIEDEVNLLDDDVLESDYASYQKYMTELASPGEGENAYNGFRQLLKADELAEYTDYDNGYAKEHYCWIRKNSKWDFGNNGYTSLPKYADQSDYLGWMKQESNIGKGLFISYGKTDKIKKVNKSPIANVDMTNYLQIAVNGHWDMMYDGQGRWLINSRNGHLQTVLQKFQDNAPVCSYKGLESLTLTPTEREVTNYILLSGKLFLNPLQQRSGPNPHNDWGNHRGSDIYTKTQGTYDQIYNNFWSSSQSVRNDNAWYHTVPSDDNGDGMYYAQKFWRCTNPRNPVYSKKTVSANPMIGNMGINKNKYLQYNYSSYRNNTDTIDNLPILTCELKVGDKYCCEDFNYKKKGTKQYQWLTAAEASQKNLPTNFTIGIDPQIEDYLIGQSFEFRNTVTHDMNIEGTGIAIPVTIDDQLKGTPEFKILYPCNILWKDYNVSFFLLPFETVDSLIGMTSVLEMIESIMVQDLKINFVSNKGKIREGMTTADNDLVYTSNENNTYNEDSENDTKVVTPLTIDECLLRGIKYQMSSSYVYHADATPFYGFTYGNNVVVKPEEVWVDYMWIQMNQPMKILSTNIKDTVLTNQQSYNTDLGYWMTCGTVSGTIGSEASHFNKGFLTRIEWDLKNRSMDMDIREAANYTPIWQ